MNKCIICDNQFQKLNEYVYKCNQCKFFMSDLKPGFGREIEAKLSSIGHKIKYQKGIFGGYQAIMLKDGVYYGASETRKDGQAAGY